MKTYTISVTLNIAAESESAACEEAISQLRIADYDMLEVVCDTFELANDSVVDWLNQLPDGYRQLALQNYKPRNRERNVDSMTVALHVAFGWGNSPEGFPFWCAVNRHYTNGAPLPALPSA